MKRFLMSLCAALLVFGIVVQDAEARRLGGGMSRGMQRESVTQRQAAPQQAAPSQQMAPQSMPQTPTAQTQKRNWLGPLAGLAAGVGLAALLSHFGMGEGLANVVMILLLVMAAVFVFKLVFRRSQPAAGRQPLQYAGLGSAADRAAVPAGREQPVGGGYSQSVAPAVGNIPADFDAEGFARVAKVNFLRLQAANDAGNLDDIREFTTPEMYAEIKLDIDDRHGARQQTDVVTLDAEVLEVVSEGNRHVASVRFYGMIREEKDGPAERFDEVWNLVKPLDGSRGWQVAGIQQLN
ncbi:MAG TPA: Tim44-like domain-containing protein [Rhodocyclaceae bacterium]|nr:Tim44-like domain-containing protein [Rhodocyclaceae bacterium]